MEKRVLLAALLSALFLAVYSNAMGRLMGPQRPPIASQGTRSPASNPEQALAKPPPSYSLQQLEQEDVTIIESPAIRFEIGQTSAAIRRVTLKQFQDASGNRLQQFGEPYNGRSSALYRDAVNRLVNAGLLEGGQEHLSVTHVGYLVADEVLAAGSHVSSSSLSSPERRGTSKKGGGLHVQYLDAVE